ncbi:MAG: exodeoxyribonuclease VII small subunit [Steroidobacteraceae bacterium]
MTRTNRGDAAAAPDFEKSLQELETLVARLERGDLPLAESLALFEQGVALTRACHGALSEAQQKVSVLLQQGGQAQPVPFDALEPDDE